jgi:hypothetical protein
MHRFWRWVTVKVSDFIGVGALDTVEITATTELFMEEEYRKKKALFSTVHGHRTAVPIIHQM